MARFYIAIIYQNSFRSFACQSSILLVVVYVVCLEFPPDNNIMSSVGCTATVGVKTQRNSESKAKIKEHQLLIYDLNTSCISTADMLTLIVEKESVYNIRDCDECNGIYMLHLSEFCYFRGTTTH